MIRLFQARVLESTDPWEKLEIDPATRALAEQAANTAGLSLEDWLERAILRAGSAAVPVKPVETLPATIPALAAAATAEILEPEAEAEPIAALDSDPLPDLWSPLTVEAEAPPSEPAPHARGGQVFRWMVMGGGIAAAIVAGVVSAQYLIPSNAHTIRVALAPNAESESAPQSAAEPTKPQATVAPAETAPTAPATPPVTVASTEPAQVPSSVAPISASPASPLPSTVANTPAAVSPPPSNDMPPASAAKTPAQGADTAARKTALAKPPAPATPKNTPPSKADKSEAPSDPQQLAAWLEQRVKNGDAVAQYRLGVLYALGDGVTQDYQRAATLFKTAAEEGVTEAEYNIAVMYAEGLGTPRDPNQAVFWYRKAAAQGSASAAFNLGVAYSNGVGVERSMEQAAQWFRRAAEGGVVNAQFNIGLLYERGDGVSPSQVEAYAWYAAAATRGDGGAAQRRDRLATTLSPAVLKDAQARANQLQASLQSTNNSHAAATPAALTPSLAKKP